MHEQLVPSWQCGSTLATARANNWYEFVALLESKFLDWPEYIFRGQRDSKNIGGWRKLIRPTPS